jgi:hypothetical protein
MFSTPSNTAVVAGGGGGGGGIVGGGGGGIDGGGTMLKQLSCMILLLLLPPIGFPMSHMEYVSAFISFIPTLLLIPTLLFNTIADGFRANEVSAISVKLTLLLSYTSDRVFLLLLL